MPTLSQPTTPPPLPARTAPNYAAWNVYYENSDSNIRHGIDAIRAAGADVIGFNELSIDAKQRMVTAHLRSKGWDATTRNSAVTIGWNAAEYTLIRKWHVVAFDNQPVESGADGSKTPLKIIMCVELEHKITKQRSACFNTHLIPSAQRGSGWDPAKPKRKALVLRQAEVLAFQMAKYAQTGNPAIGGGDMNIDFDSDAGRDLEAVFARHGLVVNWRALDPDIDTHGSRTIDWVIFTNAIMDKQVSVGKSGSDHSSVIVLDLIDAPPPPPPLELADAYIVNRPITSVPQVAGKTPKARPVGYVIDTPREFKTVLGVLGIVTLADHWYPLNALKEAPSA